MIQCKRYNLFINQCKLHVCSNCALSIVYGEMMYSGDGRIPILYMYILSEAVGQLVPPIRLLHINQPMYSN